MTWLPSRAAHVVAFTGISVGIAIGCSSSDETATDTSTFCGASKAAASGCSSSSTDCDRTLTTQCGKLDAVLNRSLLDSARDCLESGICGSSSCISRAENSMKALAGHKTLATDYCATCAPSVANCATQFYARSGNAPGSLVLPYSETIAAAVDKACVTDATCAATFPTCASDAIASAVSGAVASDVASCISASIQKDTGDQGGSTGDGGGIIVAACTPANCSSGCCRNDKCEDGTTETTCGTGAVSCQTCSGDQKCTDGACRAPCGPDNCPTCCDASGQCVPDGSGDAACGTGGETCQACADKGSTYKCINQQCIDQSCAATCLAGCCDTNGCRPGTAATGCGNNGEACVKCGSGNTCDPTARTCHLDLDSTWDFVVVSAVVPATNTSGGSWDPFGGLPDPYVIAYSNGTQAQTPAVNDTTTPAWNATTLTNITASQYLSNLSFNVWDSDYGFGVDPDDLIGGCTIPVTQKLFNGGLYYYTCAATATQGSIRLTFKFVKH